MAFTRGYGLTGESQRLGIALPPGEGNYVAVFANKARETAPGTALKLRLEIELEELIVPTPAPTAASAPAVSPAGPQSVLLEPLPVGQRLGPFTFDFSVPVIEISS